MPKRLVIECEFCWEIVPIDEFVISERRCFSCYEFDKECSTQKCYAKNCEETHGLKIGTGWNRWYGLLRNEEMLVEEYYCEDCFEEYTTEKCRGCDKKHKFIDMTYIEDKKGINPWESFFCGDCSMTKTKIETNEYAGVMNSAVLKIFGDIMTYNELKDIADKKDDTTDLKISIQDLPNNDDELLLTIYFDNKIVFDNKINPRLLCNMSYYLEELNAYVEEQEEDDDDLTIEETKKVIDFWRQQDSKTHD